MGFEPTTFDKPIFEEESLEPKKAFIISCEGENTEPEYFKAIENKLSEYIDVLIEIELVPKLSGNAPSNVVEDLKTYFEFWLLLHAVDDILSKYNTDDLYNNHKINRFKRFLDKELSEVLGNYSKKAGKFPTEIVNLENIKMAIEQEKLFKNEVEEIIDNLGSNIGQLVKRILNI